MGGRRRPPPSPELTAEMIGAMKAGTGLWRAVTLTGTPKGRALAWKAKGESDLEEGEDSPEAQWWQTVSKQRATLVAKAEHLIHKRIEQEDVGTAMWYLERVEPEEYARKNIAEVAVRGKLQELLESLRPVMGSVSYQEMIHAIATVQGLDPEPATDDSEN